MKRLSASLLLLAVLLGLLCACGSGGQTGDDIDPDVTVKVTLKEPEEPSEKAADQWEDMNVILTGLLRVMTGTGSGYRISDPDFLWAVLSACFSGDGASEEGVSADDSVVRVPAALVADYLSALLCLGSEPLEGPVHLESGVPPLGAGAVYGGDSGMYAFARQTAWEYTVRITDVLPDGSSGWVAYADVLDGDVIAARYLVTLTRNPHPLSATTRDLSYTVVAAVTMDKYDDTSDAQ